jgi:hypothetical protein
MTAVLMRTPPKKRLPRLKTLLGEPHQPHAVRRQSLDEQRAILYHLAASMGHTIERPSGKGGGEDG